MPVQGCLGVLIRRRRRVSKAVWQSSVQLNSLLFSVSLWRGLAKVAKNIYKSAVVACKSDKLSNFTGGSRFRPVCHSARLGWIGSYSILRNNVTKKRHLFAAKGALTRVKFESCITKTLKHLAQVAEMFLKTPSRYYHPGILSNCSIVTQRVRHPLTVERW